MQLDYQELLVRHRVEVSVQAVDGDDARLTVFDVLTDPMDEFTWREFGRIDLIDRDQPGFDVLPQLDAEAIEPAEKRRDTLIEDEHGGTLSIGSRRRAEQGTDGRFTRSSGAGDEGAGSSLEPTSHQPIQTR
jgi:hypothetical protein